jgi:hypothetical protein
MSSEARADIDLKARCTSSVRALQLEYIAENVSERPVFLFNILHGNFAANGVYPLLNAAYVEQEDDAVVVSQKLFPVPELMLVEQRNIPFVTRLLPRARVHEHIELALPLKPFDPYRSFKDEDLRQWIEKPLMFELGYFVGSPGTEQLGRAFPTDHGERPGFDVFTESSQKLLRVGPLGSFPTVAPRDEAQ